MGTREVVELLETKGCKSCDVYGSLIHQACQKGNQSMADEFRHKLRGYLTALEEIGVLTHQELQAAYLWYATTKRYGDKEE